MWYFLCIYYAYAPYMLTLCSCTHFLSFANSFVLLYVSLACFNLLIYHSIFSTHSVYASFFNSFVDRWDLCLLPTVWGIWFQNSSGSISAVYAVDMRNILDTDAILLSAVLICDIICPLNIIDSGVLNGLQRFQRKFSPGFLAHHLAAFHCFCTA